MFCYNLKNINITIDNSKLYISFLPLNIYEKNYTVIIISSPNNQQQMLTQMSPNYTFIYNLPIKITNIVIQIFTSNYGLIHNTILNINS